MSWYDVMTGLAPKQSSKEEAREPVNTTLVRSTATVRTKYVRASTVCMETSFPAVPAPLCDTSNRASQLADARLLPIRQLVADGYAYHCDDTVQNLKRNQGRASVFKSSFCFQGHQRRRKGDREPWVWLAAARGFCEKAATMRRSTFSQQG